VSVSVGVDVFVGVYVKVGVLDGKGVSVGSSVSVGSAVSVITSVGVTLGSTARVGTSSSLVGEQAAAKTATTSINANLRIEFSSPLHRIHLEHYSTVVWLVNVRKISHCSKGAEFDAPL
jgi:hypothetical protein